MTFDRLQSKVNKYPQPQGYIHQAEWNKLYGVNSHMELIHFINENANAAVVYMHGGGFIAGSHEFAVNQAFPFNVLTKSFSVFSLRYSFCSIFGDPNLAVWPPYPTYLYNASPNQIDETRTAIAYLKANYPQYTSWHFYGESAGAILLGHMAYSATAADRPNSICLGGPLLRYPYHQQSTGTLASFWFNGTGNALSFVPTIEQEGASVWEVQDASGVTTPTYAAYWYPTKSSWGPGLAQNVHDPIYGEEFINKLGGPSADYVFDWYGDPTVNPESLTLPEATFAKDYFPAEAVRRFFLQHN